jgi:hypothetical protein
VEVVVTPAGFDSCHSAYPSAFGLQDFLDELRAAVRSSLRSRTSHLLLKGMGKRSGGLALKTVQNIHRMLRRAFRDAVKRELVPRNVAEDASSPRVARAKPTIWTPDQLGPNGTPLHPRHHRVVPQAL